MRPAGSLLLAFAVADGCGLAAFLLRGRSRGRAASWGLVAAALACPLLIPPAHVGLRAISAVISADVAFKLVDDLRRRDLRMDFREYCAFLVPFPVFAVVYPEHRRQLSRPIDPRPEVWRLASGAAGVAGAVLALRIVSGLEPIRSSFALDHAAMLALFVVAIESLSRALLGLERLAGFDPAPIVRDAYRSRTVAEFWRRYNTRIHDWLVRNVFEPAGGPRAPARSGVLTFVVSGLFHELMFGIATSRFTGYQLAFFALQAPAALASGRLERLARRGGVAGRAVAHGSTILFLAVTSVLFFDGVARVFPFLYAAPSPISR